MRSERIAPVAALALAAGLALGGCTTAPPPTPAPSGPAAAILDDVTAADGMVTASGHVTGVAEDGGTCRFTFHASNGAASRLTATGVADGDRTTCGPVSEQLFILSPPGSYEVTLRYESDTTARVESDATPLVLP